MASTKDVYYQLLSANYSMSSLWSSLYWFILHILISDLQVLVGRFCNFWT